MTHVQSSHDTSHSSQQINIVDTKYNPKASTTNAGKEAQTPLSSDTSSASSPLSSSSSLSTSNTISNVNTSRSKKRGRGKDAKNLPAIPFEQCFKFEATCPYADCVAFQQQTIFTSPQSYQLHHAQHHHQRDKKTAGQWPCPQPECGKLCSSFYNFAAHVTTHRSLCRPAWICTLPMQLHKVVNNGHNHKTAGKTALCNKRSSTKNNLMSHIRSVHRLEAIAYKQDRNGKYVAELDESHKHRHKKRAQFASSSAVEPPRKKPRTETAALNAQQQVDLDLNQLLERALHELPAFNPDDMDITADCGISDANIVANNYVSNIIPATSHQPAALHSNCTHGNVQQHNHHDLHYHHHQHQHHHHNDTYNRCTDSHMQTHTHVQTTNCHSHFLHNTNHHDHQPATATAHHCHQHAPHCHHHHCHHHESAQQKMSELASRLLSACQNGTGFDSYDVLIQSVQEFQRLSQQTPWQPQ